MAGLALELWLQQPEQDRPSFDVHPGISALQLTAVRRNQERCFYECQPLIHILKSLQKKTLRDWLWFSRLPKAQPQTDEVSLSFLITVLSEYLRLNYLHLMNKAAEAEDRQSYFHYLKLAEKALRNGKERDGIWQPTRA